MRTPNRPHATPDLVAVSASRCREAARFLAAKNREAAKRAVGAIRQGVKVLGRHPEIGRPVPDMAPAFREWPIGFGSGGYVVLYRTDEDGVILISVRHVREAEYP